MIKDDEKWIACDPGEDFGWSVWQGTQPIDAGTDKMWEVIDALGRALVLHPLTGEVILEDDLAYKYLDIKRFVVEDWRIYPWDAKRGGLDWDQCRTARAIGAITFISRVMGLELVLQPAKIKERAEAAGAQAYFYTPLHENRHQNDSLRHGTYYVALDRGAVAINENQNFGNDQI